MKSDILMTSQRERKIGPARNSKSKAFDCLDL